MKRLVSTEPEEEVENTLPLINIVFLLLIFFMIAGALEKSDLFDIQPPKGDSAQREEKADLLIEIAQDGRIAWQGQTYTFDKAVTTLSRMESNTKSVEVKADARLDTRIALKLLNHLKTLKLEKVTLLVSAPDS